ncbi:hypothetical protein ACJX0J_027736, partial [Zea mays]
LITNSICAGLKVPSRRRSPIFGPTKLGELEAMLWMFDRGLYNKIKADMLNNNFHVVELNGASQSAL